MYVCTSYGTVHTVPSLGRGEEVVTRSIGIVD
jgi:hypothetical protein